MQNKLLFFFVLWPKRLMFNRPSPAFYSPVFSPRVASVVALNYTHTGLPCQGAYQQHFNSPAKHTDLAERGEFKKKKSLKYAFLSQA